MNWLMKEILLIVLSSIFAAGVAYGVNNTIVSHLEERMGRAEAKLEVLDKRTDKIDVHLGKIYTELGWIKGMQIQNYIQMGGKVPKEVRGE